jgi:hypothetical protein
MNEHEEEYLVDAVYAGPTVTVTVTNVAALTPDVEIWSFVCSLVVEQ